VECVEDLLSAVDALNIGDMVSIKYRRGTLGPESVVTIKLAEKQTREVVSNLRRK